MTELGFLIELLTEHKLPGATKQRIIDRLKEVESALSSRSPTVNMAASRSAVLPPGIPPQAPSTLAAMARHQEQIPDVPPPPTAPLEIAQTPAAAIALQQRQQILNDAINGQVAVKETGKMGAKSARKF